MEGLMEAAESRYAAVRGVARRARMLYAHDGKPLVETRAYSASRIAVEEFRAGKLGFMVSEKVDRERALTAEGAEGRSG